jgi:plasmid stabilization system protein ParE
MEIKWTSKSVSDLKRLYEFLAQANKNAAIQMVQKLVNAPTNLLVNPRLGKKLEEFSPLEVRHFFVGNYEVRYEIRGTIIYVLRLWHTKENR